MIKSIDVSNSSFNGSVESIPYGVKKRLVLSRSFYLQQSVYAEMLTAVEHDIPKSHGISDMEFVINTIDQYGEWLHS